MNGNSLMWPEAASHGLSGLSSSAAHFLGLHGTDLDAMEFDFFTALHEPTLVLSRVASFKMSYNVL